MAMAVYRPRVGVDVAKVELVVCHEHESTPLTLPNQRPAIRRYLKGLPGPVCLAVEATNTFHLALIEEAHALGHTVYLIDGFRLNRYRESIGGRAKTDSSDAQLLVRYLQREQEDLRPWCPPPQGYLPLVRLLRRRTSLIQAKVALTQSLEALPELKISVRAVLRQLERLDGLIQKRLRHGLIEHGWAEQAKRCQAIEGVGEITAAAMAITFQRGEFANSDAFIAFLGLDVRVRDSGQSRGRRKLTKKGDPELRRLLYMAAMTASRSATWRGFYQRQLSRGLSRIAALVILGRKLARVAFALMRNKTDYQPNQNAAA